MYNKTSIISSGNGERIKWSAVVEEKNKCCSKKNFCLQLLS